MSGGEMAVEGAVLVATRELQQSCKENCSCISLRRQRVKPPMSPKFSSVAKDVWTKYGLEM